MSDILTAAVDRLKVKCPVHDKEMVGKRHEVKTGYRGFVRKIMIVGVCPEKDCGKWFEFLPFEGMILWP